jgi:uncharacterized protein YbjT (DUF2867 family)
VREDSADVDAVEAQVRVLVMGAAGKTGRLVVERLLASGHEVSGMVRTEEQSALMTELGAAAVRGDLTGDLSAALNGMEAVVFCAGAPLGGDPVAIDRVACIAAQRAAETAGVRRWVQMSSLMADRPETGPPPLLTFLQAKQISDAALLDTGLAWTVVRPGGLQDVPGTGLVSSDAQPGFNALPRYDVAAVLAEVVAAENTVGKSFDLVAGDIGVKEFVAQL